MADPKSLIGRKVNLAIGENTYGDRVYTTYRLDDDEFKSYMKLTYGDNIRYKLPNGVFTQDLRMNRLNVLIDNKGIITGVHYG